jgi:hypothetical protein
MMLQANALAKLSGIRHAFFTREGGVSGGIYASLNGGVGSNDFADNVTENRARMATALGVSPEHFLTTYQIHSPAVVVAEQPWTLDDRHGLRLASRPRIAVRCYSPTRRHVSSPPPTPAGAAHWAGSSERRSTRWSGWAPSAPASLLRLVR